MVRETAELADGFARRVCCLSLDIDASKHLHVSLNDVKELTVDN